MRAGRIIPVSAAAGRWVHAQSAPPQRRPGAQAAKVPAFEPFEAAGTAERCPTVDFLRGWSGHPP
jgi:hypothetical protein